eukprot:56229-Rhodomonas_salina.1
MGQAQSVGSILDGGERTADAISTVWRFRERAAEVQDAVQRGAQLVRHALQEPASAQAGPFAFRTEDETFLVSTGIGKWCPPHRNYVMDSVGVLADADGKKSFGVDNPGSSQAFS